MSTIMSHGDCSEITGILAGLAHAELAVIRHHIPGNGAALAGGTDYLNYIFRISAAGAKTFCQSDSLSYDFPFPVYAATKLCLRAWDYMIWDLVSFLFQCALPGKSRHFV